MCMHTSFCVESPSARDWRREMGRPLGSKLAEAVSRREKDSYERLETSPRGRVEGSATARAGRIARSEDLIAAVGY